MTTYNKKFRVKHGLISDGDVGIGTDSPTEALSIKSDDGRVSTTSNVSKNAAGVLTGGYLIYSGDGSGPSEGNRAGIQSFTEGTAGTTYDLRFYTSDGSTNLVEAMRIDGSGNVGIGGSPGAKLDVNTGTVNTLAHFHSTDDNAFIELQDDDTTGYIGVQNDYLYIGGAPSNNAQNINIHKTTGNVGIGTASPTVPLHISSTGHTQYQQHRQSSGVGVGQEMKFAFNTADGTEEVYGSIYTDIKANTNGAESGNIALRVADAGSLSYVIHGAGGGDTKLYADGAIVMTLQDGGKVGIGKAPSTWHLDVDSTDNYIASFDGSNNTGIAINSSPGIGDIVGYSNSASSYNKINIRGASGTGLVVDTSNNVGIGTTSPAAPLHISKAIGASVQTTVLDLESVNSGDQNSSQTCQIDFSLIDSNTNTGVPQVRLGAVGNDTGNQAYEAGGRFSIYLASQNYPSPSLNEKFRIDEEFNGDTYTNDGSISSLSDIRVKTNIQDLTDGIDVLKQLRPVTFEYDNDGSDLGAKDGVTRYGLIADEVKSVAPHYVNESTGYIKGEVVNDYKTLSLTRMIPMLIKSIQELSTELDAAKARITTLEG